jgi:hypothetical protein
MQKTNSAAKRIQPAADIFFRNAILDKPEVWGIITGRGEKSCPQNDPRPELPLT